MPEDVSHRPKDRAGVYSLMANIGLVNRLRIAGAGLRTAWREDGGVRNQLIGTIAMVIALVIVRPSAYWWALAIFATSATVAMELMNSALERTIDYVHSEFDPAIKKLKDIAAAAVVVASFGVLVIGILMILSVYGPSDWAAL